MRDARSTAAREEDSPLFITTTIKAMIAAEDVAIVLGICQPFAALIAGAVAPVVPMIWHHG